MPSLTKSPMLRVRQGSNKAGLVLGYALTTLLLGVSGLLFIPAVVHAAGPYVWAAVAVGQAFGVVVAVIVGYGWALTGPALIAGMSTADQVTEFRRSLFGRTLVGLPAIVMGTLLLWWLYPGNEVSTGLALLATAMTGLSSNWLFVGVGRPYVLLWSETVPRTLMTLLAIGLLGAGYPLEFGLATQCAGLVIGLALSYLVTWRWLRIGSGNATLPRGSSARGVLAALKAQSHGMTSSLISVIFISAPVLVVGLVAPAALPAFALADKIQKQFISGITPVVSVAQGWVPKGRARTDVVQRSRRALVFSAGLALFAGLCLYLVGPLLWNFLGAGQIVVDRRMLLLVALVCGSIFFERIVSRAALIPLGGAGRLVAATLAGSLVGVSAVLGLVFIGGASGALLGVLLGFIVTITVELYSWNKLARPEGRRRLS